MEYSEKIKNKKKIINNNKMHNFLNKTNETVIPKTESDNGYNLCNKFCSVEGPSSGNNNTYFYNEATGNCSCYQNGSKNNYTDVFGKKNNQNDNGGYGWILWLVGVLFVVLLIILIISLTNDNGKSGSKSRSGSRSRS